MNAARRHRERRTQKPATLNLVSLMDIFTILVFFLMVNSSNVQVLETTSDIKLPDSGEETVPEERIAISISADNIIVQGREVARIEDVLAAEDPVIEGLAIELAYQAQRRRSGEGAVTILGDRGLPYEVLKRVMVTCQQSDFTRIALGVNQVVDDGGEDV